MYSPDLVEFVEVVVMSGLIAAFALAIASSIGFSIAFGLFRESAVATQPVDLPAAVPAKAAEPLSTLPAGPRRPAEHAPMVAG